VKLVAVGDVVAEIVGEFDRRFVDVDRDVLSYGPVRLRVGGTAANLAFAARDHFDDVLLAGVVGDDPIADSLDGVLRGAGIRTRLRRKPGVASGLAIYVRDGGVDGTGVRLLLVGQPSALPLFDGRDAEGLRPELAGADFLVVDGYAFRSPLRRAATLAIMAWARQGRTEVVYDVVPHDCFRWQTLAQLQRDTHDATIIVVEARTLNALAGEPWSDGDTDLDAALRAGQTGREAFAGRRIYLRFGVGNIDETLLMRPTGPADRYSTGYSSTDEPRGFGDRLLAGELSRMAAGD
jgi:sugar/nucleoside kinase (ribokinase family)